VKKRLQEERKEGALATPTRILTTEGRTTGTTATVPPGRARAGGEGRGRKRGREEERKRKQALEYDTT